MIIDNNHNDNETFAGLKIEPRASSLVPIIMLQYLFIG